VKNQAEALIHSSEKSLSDYGDKVSEDDRKAIENAIAELKTATEGDDADAIRAKTTALAEASMKLGQAVYEASQAENAGDDAEGGGGAKANDDVVDADFEEIDEDDKKSA
jgi:molecular chaperone DnaK